ncbi:hypothetical protein NM688_g2033 [Phlebia brevispora]|uniref:Uncharacterized protein n=1 Tax=Phlebia brevispora TaxID=194682 RepID=A0ACC1T9E4_9APHY|nr:hypothetical protein NM688_g2033 [Phlebia brevispora]
MQDSDDLYFGNDDLIVDDATLAALDAAERTYVATQAPQPLRTNKTGSPPPKRIKVNHDWDGQRHAKKRSRDTFDTVEDPDIFVEDGGLYAVPTALQHKAPSTTVVRVPGSQEPPRRVISHRKPVSNPARTANIPINATAGPSKVRQESLARHASGPVFGSQSSTRSKTPVPSAISTARNKTHRVAPKTGPEAEVARLKRQIEMLNAQLEDSKTQVVHKEGEVAVLRATMQKSAEEHATELAKIETAKTEAEIARAQLQKEHKEELERLKTLYVFKQHEVETSVRKPPWSSKKAIQQMNITPLRVPPEIRAWSSNVPNPDLTATPRRQRIRDMETPSRPPREAALSQRPSDSQILPGFFNSFAQASPSRPLSQRERQKGKGKERMRDEDVFVAPPSPPSSPTRYGMRMAEVPDLPMEDAQPAAAFQEPPLQSSPGYRGGDVQMSTPPIADESVQEPIGAYETPDWTDTLHRLLFAHTMPSAKMPTLQLLLNSPLPASTSPEDLHAYTSITARLLETVAKGSDFVEWISHLRAVLDVLSDISALLVSNGSILALTALFNMLRSMAYTIPSFAEAVLAPLPDEPEGTPAKIAVTMRDAIQRYAAGDKEKTRDATTAWLASEVVSLLEALSWNVPENIVPRLCAFLRAPNVLMTLLGPKQPVTLVRDTARALSILATHPNFFRQLLAHPYPAAGQEDVHNQDTRSIEHLDQLYAYLADSAKDTDLKDTILSFITTVALAHADAVTILLQSYILIPSIITYLTDATNPLWEEDLDLMASQTQIDQTIQTTNRLVALLTYLLFSSPTTYNLRYKLHHLPHRRFNGIAHIYTVTMSRLSFADPPGWLTEVQRVKLEQTTDMATKLLELVIDGPELELAWSAFQVDTESRPESDEEREARLLHPDDTESSRVLGRDRIDTSERGRRADPKPETTMTSSAPSLMRKDRVRVVAIMFPKDGISFEEFDRYWLTEHSKLFSSLDIVKKNLLKYEQFHFNPPANQLLAGLGIPQSQAAGIAIFEGESFEKIFEVFQHPEYLRIVVPDELKFMNREKSQLIAGELATVFGS